MDPVKRVNYFQGMMLVDEDFRDEQNYHRQTQHNHNLELHTWGVVRGLEVSLKKGALDVAEGLAIDANGKQIWWRGGAPTIAASPDDGAYLVIEWNEELSDEYSQMAGRFLRLIDACKFSFKSAAAVNDVVLAKISVKEGQIQEQPDNSVRRTASSVRANGGDLEIRPVAGNGSLRLMTGAPLTARLSIDATGNVGIGTAPTPSRLSIYSEAGPDYSGSLMDFIVGGPYKLSLGFKALERDGVSYHLDLHNNLGNKFEKFLVFHKGNVRVANDLSVSGALNVRGGLTLRVGADDRPDTNHGLRYFGEGDKDAGEFALDGPVLYGYQGGALGNSAKKIALRWDGSGNVGIGNATSGAKLTVSGPDSTTTIETKELVRLLRPGVPGVKNGHSAGFLVGASEEGINGKARLDIAVTGAPGIGNTWGNVPDLTVMSLLGSGNVGIGTTKPLSSLSISRVTTNNNTAGQTIGELSFIGFSRPAPSASILALSKDWDDTGHLIFKTSPSSAGAQERMRITSDGNVGIGTTNPQRPLQIGGLIPTSSVAAIGFDASDGSPNAGYVRFGDGTGWKLHFGQAETGGNLVKGTEKVFMTLQDNGNVGIGTTTPKAKLDVGDMTPGVKSVLARMSEGNDVRDPGTCLAVTSYTTQGEGATSFAIEHYFYGIKNGSITFCRGGGANNGWVKFAGTDLAELFESAEQIVPGDVVVFDAQDSVVKLCESEADNCVIGIVSGAPGAVLGKDDNNGSPIALCGRVPCNVDADIAPIQFGDLLTTSPTKGHAQKVLAEKNAAGAIIGKALGSLGKGKGQITVLVALA